MTLEAKWIMTLHVQLDPPRAVGGVRGNLNIIPIIGGRFEGPQVKGVVCGGGADWNTGLTPTISHVSAQYWLETDDGYAIAVYNEGVLDAARTDARIKTVPRFQVAADSPYAFLLSGVFVGELEVARPDEVVITVYQML